ncbi:MAG: DoxX family protein [Gammaproteobacteria bacterium]|jgi:putative oxidoreductase
MTLTNAYSILIQLPERIVRPLQHLLLLGLRFYVGWQFFNAGLLKLGSWENTLFLFRYEYEVPILSPYPAAVLGTFGEIFFPALLFVGLFGRLSALGLQAVNVMAVVAYAHVIFNPEFGTGAAADHYFWGLMLLVILVFGPGKYSADEWLARFRNRKAAPTDSSSLEFAGRLQS